MILASRPHSRRKNLALPSSSSARGGKRTEHRHQRQCARPTPLRHSLLLAHARRPPTDTVAAAGEQEIAADLEGRQARYALPLAFAAERRYAGTREGSTDANRASANPYGLNAASVTVNALFEKLDGGLTGIRLYGIAPPKLASDPERLREIAAQQVARLRLLAPDGLVVYDIQDEPGRSGQARPFPFLPTFDPEVYARDELADLAIPKIVYRCVSAHPREVFSSWLDTVRAAAGRSLNVFVGAPRGRSRSPGLPLDEA